MIPDETRVDGPRGDRPVHPPHGGRPRALTPRLTGTAADDAGERSRDVRETVRNGGPGPSVREQRSAPGVALGRDAGDELAAELRAFDRLRQGLLPLRRAWSSVREIRAAVDQTVRPWMPPLRVHLVWDGGDDPTWQTYADPHLLRRLLVNLVGDAVREATAGGAVLVHVRKARRDEVIRWSVVHRGVTSAPQRLGTPGQAGPVPSGADSFSADADSFSAGADSFSADADSFSADAGEAGWAIAGQLADLNFATLNASSRLGFGTAIWFETPAAGPRSVASCWTRWRNGWNVPIPGSHRRSPHFGRIQSRGVGRAVRDEDGVRSVLAGRADASGRIPAVARTPASHTRVDGRPTVIRVGPFGRGPESPRLLIAGIVSVGGTVPQAAADRFDEIFQDRLRKFDFTYRTSPRTWAWFCDADTGGYRDRVRQIEEALERESGRIRLRWGRPQRMGVDDHGFRIRVTDWLIRQQLSATFRVGIDVTGLRVAVGEQGVPRSSTSAAATAARLDREVRRLRRRGHH